MKTYVFEVEIERDPEDGIWEAEIPVLPGCAVWGYTKEETLEALREAAKAYLDVSLEYGDPIPPGIEASSMVSNADLLAVTV